MSDALISPCGTYRYTLGRNIPSILRWHRPCLFVMLNPSTADASLNDPTIRRCMAFAKREGRTFLTVVNLFALRATDPTELKKHPDPFGPDNVEHVSRELRRHNQQGGGLIIAAWGANEMARTHPAAVVTARRIAEAGAMCCGVTKDGSPRHPLYLRSDAPLVPWRMPEGGRP